MKLSKDETTLNITNIKFKTKEKYINEADPSVVKEMRNQYMNERMLYNHNLYKDPEYSHHFDWSSATCKFNDISGYIFGGLSSRFWMHRA